MDTRIEHEKTSWLSKGYGLAPFLLMGDPRISVGAKGLFCYLSSIAGAVINEEFGGRASWPSRKRICRDLNINKDTFTVYLDELKRHGFIRVIQRRTSGKFSCNVYVIQEYIEPLSRKLEEKSQLEPCPNLSDAVLSEPISSDTVFSDATNTNDLPLSDRTMITSMNSAAVVAASCRPKRSRRKATDNLERALRRDYPEAFNRFWKEYPRKDDKAAAYEIWQVLLASEHLGVTAEDLIAAARAYAVQMEREGREKRHIKLCKTWLNSSLAEYLPGTDDFQERSQDISNDPFSFSEDVKARILGL